MKKVLTIFVALIMFCVWVVSSEATSIFINEIHYDNARGDIGEGIEIAGHAGDNLTGWSIVFYNGSSGQQYNRTLSLSGVILDQQSDFWVLYFSISKIQNGDPDGMALVDSNNAVVQFLSYEGSFEAIGGPADGLTSIDIGVSESGRTPVGYSLQLTGTGSVYEDFTWAGPMANTYNNNINTEQTFASPVPEPSTVLLLTTGMVGLLGFRKRFRNSGI